MPEWISIPEASRRYLVSDKSIRNWIKAGLLTPEKVRIGGKWQYKLQPEQLEEVMRERNMIAIPIRPSDEQSRITALEHKVSELTRRVGLLEAQKHAEYSATIPVASMPPQAEDETMEVREFTARHNLHIGQVRNVVGSVTHIDKAGMHAVWVEHHTKTRFRKCDFCPHE